MSAIATPTRTAPAAPPAADGTVAEVPSSIFVGRQPVFDKRRNVYG